ncbi:TonB-dependent receptor [Massilia sp. TS11]|uniref:TonB-dependent receptor n=1 Tax=Massilia sp. TS11 TaxID=2908003 RepID=UPI001EDA4142|nr:TonB-dependent receptor [Massilia sp. TS11]MCG2583919.1 TonB-dependent receptor [Massilia sp. TS11]
MKNLDQPRRVLNTKRCGTYLAIMSAFAGASAYAQSTPPASKDDTATVIVSGTRKSIESSIDRKMKASTVVDSIVAEDIGQFPDKNVGEALSRVTGVQLQREFGEGSTVAIRGVEPDLNRVEIDGASVLSTNGTNPGGRGAELREMPAELIQSIDVYKGTTADLVEGGVGGSVIIKTRKPLDFKKFTMAANASAEQSSLRGGVQPRGSLFITDRFLDGRLGLLANVVYDKVFTRNDYIRNTSWTYLRDWDFSPDKTNVSTDPTLAAITTPAGCASLPTASQRNCQLQWYDYAPQIPRYGQWSRDHNRNSTQLMAQYQIDKGFNVYVAGQRNTQHQTLTDRNFGTDNSFNSTTGTTALRLSNAGTAPVYDPKTGLASKAGTCTPVSTAVTPAGVTTADHIETSYTVGNCLYVANQGGQGAFSTATRFFKQDITSNYYNGGFEYKNGGLEAEGQITKSDAFYTNDTNNLIMTQNAPGLQVSLDSKGLPHFTFPSAYDPSNPGSYVQAALQYRPVEQKTTEDQVKLDLRYRTGWNFLERVMFGVRASKGTMANYAGGGYMVSPGVYVQTANVTQNINYDPFNNTGTLPVQQNPANIASLPTWNRFVNSATMQNIASSLLTERSDNFYTSYSGVSGFPSSWIAPGYQNVGQFFDLSKFNHDYLYTAPGSDGKTYDQIPAYKMAERTRAAYLRGDWGTELFGHDVRGNVGVRYVKTYETAIGLTRTQVRTATAPGASTYTDTITANGITSIDNTYNDILPSFNAVVNIIPDTFNVRLGWGKVMARPNIQQLSPGITCTLGSGLAQFGGNGYDVCSATGNPDLKPFRATNKDLSLEYSVNRDTFLSLAYFQKNITVGSPISTTLTGVDFFGDGKQWQVTLPVNAPGATTRGVEIAVRHALTWLPGWARGFGLDTNFTRMNFSYAQGLERLNPLDNSILPYPGLSKNSYNIGLWYDLGPINARIAYNHRDRYYTGSLDVSKNPVFIETTGYLDAKIQYRYSDQITFSLEGKNLSNQNQVSDAGSLSRVNEYIWSGRRYYAGMSVKF